MLFQALHVLLQAFAVLFDYQERPGALQQLGTIIPAAAIIDNNRTGADASPDVLQVRHAWLAHTQPHAPPPGVVPRQHRIERRLG